MEKKSDKINKWKSKYITSIYKFVLNLILPKKIAGQKYALILPI